MKVAVSIPDDVFQRADVIARQLKTSRSRLYARALEEYVARHSPEEITALANALADELGDEPDAFVAAACRTVLQNTEW